MKSTKLIRAGGRKRLSIPGMNFGERQALAHWAKQAKMSPEEMVRECVRETAWEIAWLKTSE